MSDELERLMNELKTFIAMKGGKVTCNDLVKWSEDHEIGLITLQTIIQELSRRGIIKRSSKSKSFEVLPLITIEIPEEIQLTSATKKSTAEKRERIRRVRKSITGVHSILEYVTPEKVEKKEKAIAIVEKAKPKVKKEEIKREIKKEVKKEAKAISVLPPKPTPKPEKRVVTKEKIVEKEEKRVEEVKKVEIEKTKETTFEEDLDKAIRYLNTYWSVGEIRFMIDMKALGVKDPSKVLQKLLELGYVERNPLGVINATKKLPKVSKEEYITELFF